MSVAEQEAKLVGGIWLPGTEVHFVDMLTSDRKNTQMRDGVATYQIRKFDRCMKELSSSRRRMAIDIGAHVGLWAMWMVKHFQLVHAFEPVPQHRELFKRNVKGRYRLWGLALGDVPGTRDIEVPMEQTAGAHVAVPGWKAGGDKYAPHPERKYLVRGVPVRCLDDWDWWHVDFVKIDVEGYERRILLGGERMLRRCQPLIIVEQKGNEAPYGEPHEAAAEWLESIGYKRVVCISGDWIMRWKA